MTKKRNKMTFTEGMKAQFSTKSIVLIPIAVGINLIGGTLCSALKLPLFLDMIGTIVIAATKDIMMSVFSSSFIENLIDKGIAFFIAYIIVQKIPKRFLSQYAADTMEEDDEDEDEAE